MPRDKDRSPRGHRSDGEAPVMFRASRNWRYVGTHQFQAGIGSNVAATAPLTLHLTL
jgi:hypothetical protein